MNLLGIPEEGQEEAVESTEPQNQEPANAAAATPPAEPTDPLSIALKINQDLARQLKDNDEKWQKRHSDTRSYYDKQFNDLKKQLSATPLGSEEWQQVLSDPDKMREWLATQEVGQKGPSLSPVDIKRLEVRNMIEDFERKNPKAKIPAYAQMISAQVSKLVDDPSTEITERMLQGALEYTDELFGSAEALSKGNGNGKAGGQPGAGNGANGQINSQEKTTDSSISKFLPPPPNITGASGVAGGAEPKVKTPDDLKRFLRRIDYNIKDPA